MSNGSELKSRGATALRAAGYKPCPRWWLTQEQLDLLEYMAKQNEVEVNRIRRAALTAPTTAPLTKEEEIELAWRRMKTGGENT
jgi:hypothetical protein